MTLNNNSDEISFIRKKKVEEMLKRLAFSQQKDKLSAMPIFDHANSKNFSFKVIERSTILPVLVDFYADWCMPCIMLSPILERLVHAENGKIALVKVNIDESRSLAETYSIMSIPALKLFKDKKIIAEHIGFVSEQQLKYWIEKALQKCQKQ
ncbi:thioredoxin [Candidatus Woesearchaeota archaeon]|nr:MAG: thioredoxin [Candidatus Woesearchaeota archaeon]